MFAVMSHPGCMYEQKRSDVNCRQPCCGLKATAFVSVRGVNPRRVGRVEQMEDRKNLGILDQTKLQSESQLY